MAGGLVGAVTGVIVSSAGLFLGSQFSTSGCGVAIAVGTVLVVLAAALGFVAWKLIRHPGQSPALVFARGATGVMAVFLLAPWPCSFTGAAFFTIWSACGHH